MIYNPLYVGYDDYSKCYHCSKKINETTYEYYYFDNFKKFSKFCMLHINSLRRENDK